MKRLLSIMMLATITVAAAGEESAKVSLGVFDQWGAFSDPSPRRCYAIAQPVAPGAPRVVPGGAKRADTPRDGAGQNRAGQDKVGQNKAGQSAAAPRARWRAFASIATWPGQGVRNQLHLRLSHERDSRARVTLSVGERRFALIAGSADAWSPDKRTDAAVVAAIRSGRSMSVETLSRTGQPFADVYPLRGAATAIDAASLGCARG